MRAKLNGGPEHGKYYDIRDGYGEFLVEVMDPKFDPWAAGRDRVDPYERIPRKRGSYKPSNSRLKNGTPIWQWMGWYPN